jgi:hypothetical protein
MEKQIQLLPKQSKYIMGFPNHCVSMEGEVYSIARTNEWVKIRKIIKDDGYLCVRIGYNKKYRYFNIGRLVLMTFSPPLDAKHQCDHIDGNKLNNNLGNLQWLTQKANLLKKYRADGNKIHFSKEVYKLDKLGNILCTYPSMLDAAKVNIGTSSSSISKVCRGIFKQSGGYKWKYAN